MIKSPLDPNAVAVKARALFPQKKQTLNRSDAEKRLTPDDPRYRSDPDIMLGCYIAAMRILSRWNTAIIAGENSCVSHSYWEKLESARSMPNRKGIVARIAEEAGIDPAMIWEAVCHVENNMTENLMAEGMLPVKIYRKSGSPNVVRVQLDGVINLDEGAKLTVS